MPELGVPQSDPKPEPWPPAWMASPEVLAGRVNTELGDPRFHAALKELAELHARKAADYGTDADVFANVRASAEFGIPPHVGALIRLNDKVTRLKTFALKGTLKNEGMVDTLMDLAAYAIIARILFEESQQGPRPTAIDEDQK